MGNPISMKVKIGTIGELLVQIRLLQYEVQSAPPLKDSGNDLIAIRGEIFRALHVKTTALDSFSINLRKLPRIYHILALVHLVGENEKIGLDASQIFLLHKNEVVKSSFTLKELKQYECNKKRVDALFS